MKIHLLAMAFVVIGFVTGVIVAVTTSIGTGIVVGVIIIGVGALIGIINMSRLWRDPKKLMPKNW